MAGRGAARRPGTRRWDSWAAPPDTQGAVPGAAGRPHTVIEGAGHFLQEDKGEELARVVVDFVTA